MMQLKVCLFTCIFVFVLEVDSSCFWLFWHLNAPFLVHTGEYVDMVKAGIIDPLKVIRTALTDAARWAEQLWSNTFSFVKSIKYARVCVPMLNVILSSAACHLWWPQRKLLWLNYQRMRSLPLKWEVAWAAWAEWTTKTLRKHQ